MQPTILPLTRGTKRFAPINRHGDDSINKKNGSRNEVGVAYRGPKRSRQAVDDSERRVPNVTYDGDEADTITDGDERTDDGLSESENESEDIIENGTADTMRKPPRKRVPSNANAAWIDIQNITATATAAVTQHWTGDGG